ncbi:glycerophosphodiester phosphodiesterase family protein [Alkalihalobacterium alkalinitrilicum]|uniref:glycerophosphodiester phosphodiesterase family protein n=1 Tax=Alkalihalobacterium alkalinitrilicum TaxID=427920 RepID=UPI000995724C|nr:glycerophosphodiester phosphodiesterase family protein [Alkalihalobacterium alkalinitrilicum]
MNNIHTEVIAHRGLSALYPENTMLAFKEAAKLPIEAIEMDVQLTKDKVPVIIHDLALDRTTEGQGLVRDHTFQQIRTYSAGAWFSEEYRKERVPTLEEVLIWARNYPLKVNLELKGVACDREDLWEKVKMLIDQYKMSTQVLISSFDHVLIANILKEGPTIETAIIVTSSMYQPLSYIRSIGTEGFHYYYPMMLNEETKALLRAGIQVRPYTINDVEMMKYSYQLGVKGIFTDYPHIALKIREELSNYK